MKVTDQRVVDPARIHRILIRGVNWVGDAVMTTPAIAGIRKTFPGARITLLVKPNVAGVFEGNPHIDEILLYDGSGRHAGLVGFLRLARELREYGFDLAILLQNAFEAALLTILARIPHRVGYKTQGRGFLLTTAVVKDQSVKALHHVQYYQALVKGAGWVEEKQQPMLYVSRGAAERASALLREEGVKSEESLVAFNAGSTYGSAKRWPADRYAAVADELIERLGVKIVLTGSRGDEGVARAIRSQARRPDHIVDLTGRTDIQLLAAILRRCSVFVSNDTGAMHVGAAVGAPLVAIFGPTDPTTTSPVGSHVLLRHPVPCSPCLLRDCPIDHRCMTGISVDQTTSTVINIYNDNSKAML